MYNKILLYGHGGAYNHGAEAIVKCTIKELRQQFPEIPIYLSTHFKEQDLEFGIKADFLERDEQYLEIDRNSNVKGMYDLEIYKSTIKIIDKDTLCISIGGDNYCYRNWRRWKCINDYARSVGAKTVLWSCSIGKEFLNEEMVEVLSRHHLITVRERDSYVLLKSMGLNNVKICSEIAFLLEPEQCEIPKGFDSGAIIMNLSPLVVRKIMKFILNI